MAVKASASITLSRVNDGATGPAGVGIKSVDVEYYLSTSNTAQTGGSWSTTAPAWVDGKYMWSRTKTITTDNQTKYSSPACITGGKGNTGSTGATGSTGTGITSITEEYYLSTSKTTQTGGSWVTTPPTWSPGKYMWTRSKIVYKNPTSTAYTTPICDSSWEAVNEIEVGGRNYVLNSAFLKGSEHWTLSSTNKVNIDTNVKFEGCNTLHINLSGNSSNAWSGASQQEVISNPSKGDYYTVSFMYLVKDKSKLDSGFTVELKGVSSTGASVGIGGYRVIHASEITDNMWDRYTYTFELKTENVVSLNAFPWVMKNGEVWITQVKIERGKTATSWSPNPEDIEERVKDAEQKIEPGQIIATVEEQVNKNGSTVLATRSFVEQTAEQVKYEFESSANNLITNSLFPNTDTTGWTWWTAFKFGNTSYFKEGDMWIANTSTTSHGLFYQTYATPINHNTTYTLSIAAQAEGNVNMEGTKIRIAFKAEENNINSSISIIDLPIVWDFKRRSYTFKVPNDSNIKYAMLIIRHGGLKPGTSGGYLVRINRPCLMQGTVAPYQPSANELISAKTIINRDGVTIVEGAIRVKNNSGQTILTGDSDGNLTLTGKVINGSNGLVSYLDRGGLILETTNEKVGYIRSSSFASNRAINGISIGTLGKGDFVDIGYTTDNDLGSDTTLAPAIRIAKTDHSLIGSFVGIQLKAQTIVDYGKLFKFQNNSPYTSDIYANDSGKLCIMGDNGLILGYKEGDSYTTALSIDESSKNVDLYGNARDVKDGYAYEIMSRKKYGSVEKFAPRINNLNTYLDSGWYSFGSDCVGAPTSWGILLTFRAFGKDMCQIVHGTNNVLYIRWYVVTSAGGSYTSWKQW